MIRKEPRALVSRVKGASQRWSLSMHLGDLTAHLIPVPVRQESLRASLTQAGGLADVKRNNQS